MKKVLYLFIFFFSLVTIEVMAKEIVTLKLSYGDVQIELYPEKAPNHVKRFKELANSGKYDGVVFHRVIDGFMAQTGDVKFGNSNNPDFSELFSAAKKTNVYLPFSLSRLLTSFNPKRVQ